MSRRVYKKRYSWNSGLAYVTGLFASDGCLSNDGRHLTLVSKDWGIVEDAMKILGLTVQVKQKKGGYGTYAWQLQFSNVALYDFWQNIGLTPAKSKTIASLRVPDKFYADFLRGYFDGDGTVYGFWDTRWQNSMMYYTEYVSASRPFLKWLQAQNSKLAGTTSGSIRNGARASILSYAKKDSVKLFSYMYAEQSAPKLDRKYQKYVAFLEADPYNTPDDARVL